MEHLTFVLDWDDTLFPSTWLRHLVGRGRRCIRGETLSREYAAFVAYTHALERFLVAVDAVSPGRAMILTASSNGWARHVSSLAFAGESTPEVFGRVLARIEALPVVEVAPSAKGPAFATLAARDIPLFAMSDSEDDRTTFLDACDGEALPPALQRHVRFVPSPSVGELTHELDQMTATVAELASRDGERVDLAISITYDYTLSGPIHHGPRMSEVRAAPGFLERLDRAYPTLSTTVA